MKKEHEDDIKNNIGLVKKLKSARALLLMKNMYNCLCLNCRVLVFNNPKIPLEAYCDKCRPKVEQKLNKLQKVIGKK